MKTRKATQRQEEISKRNKHWACKFNTFFFQINIYFSKKKKVSLHRIVVTYLLRKIYIYIVWTQKQKIKIERKKFAVKKILVGKCLVHLAVSCFNRVCFSRVYLCDIVVLFLLLLGEMMMHKKELCKERGIFCGLKFSVEIANSKVYLTKFSIQCVFFV